MKNLLPAILLLLGRLISSSQSYVITGVHAGINNETGARPFRQEINKFKSSGPAWDLYVLSLQHLMAVDQDDQYSYYRISGIHGYPANTPWDGVIGTTGGVGYCEHGSTLFPVWHRPYLALFEEKVWELAQKIAVEYPVSQRAIYEAAAISLRIPYWDWSLNSSLPDVTSRTQIYITTPTGGKIIDNPLYAYRFHPLRGDDLPFLSQYPTTVREPNSDTLKSQNDLVNQGLMGTAEYWHDKAYLLFSSVSDWNTFASNIEKLHGGIHIYVGGPKSPNNGHMTFLWYSAFDPIFWLHHAQVDRLVAIWQAIHPYTYIKPKASTITTYYVPVGTIQDENSPLAPFHKNGEGGFYTGQTVRRLKTFGYSYPELVYWSKTGSDVLSLQKEVISTVNGLYHPKYAMINEELNGAEANKLNLYLPTGYSLGADWEWKFELNINQAQIETPMAVYFFNSNHSLASGSVRMKNGRFIIGPKVFLLPKTEEKMATPFSSSSASVPLTQTLLSLGSLEPDMVLPWIKNNILWRSVKPPDYDAHGADVGSTDEQAAESHIPHSAIEMTLVARKIAQSSNRSKFPIYGPWMEYGSTRLMGHGGHVDLDF